MTVFNCSEREVANSHGNSWDFILWASYYDKRVPCLKPQSLEGRGRGMNSRLAWAIWTLTAWRGGTDTTRKVNSVQSKGRAKSSHAITSPLHSSTENCSTPLRLARTRETEISAYICLWQNPTPRGGIWKLQIWISFLSLSNGNEYSIPTTKVPLEILRGTVRRPILLPMTVNRGLVRILTRPNSNDVHLDPWGWQEGPSRKPKLLLLGT